MNATHNTRGTVIRRAAWGAAAATAVALVMSSCGGHHYDGSSSPPPVTPPPVTSEVPQSASGSIAGFIAYLKALLAAPADTLEPVPTPASVTGPTSETSEPVNVD